MTTQLYPGFCLLKKYHYFIVVNGLQLFSVMLMCAMEVVIADMKEYDKVIAVGKGSNFTMFYYSIFNKTPDKLPMASLCLFYFLMLSLVFVSNQI
ncbi:TPA: hypothetical protein ACJI3N_004028 [Raoultella planticola]